MPISRKTPSILFGGDYNPDQWDEQTIDHDIALFHKANINLVTLPVFSWAKLEPEEGVYRFEWLDRILEKLWDNRIYVCLATPTAAQPAWLSRQYPEVLPVDIAGRKRTHGMRVFFCVNSEKYRERAAALAEQMAKRYHDYPGLVAWHVSNEYGTYCYCENCQRKFRKWLQDRYGTVEELNRRWNTSVWGRTVYDFKDVMLPTELNDDYRFAPAIELDYLRFVTDSTRECFMNEARILKKYTPDVPVFSNISGLLKKLDQNRMTECMDYAAWDNYPGPADSTSFPAMKHDIMRGLKNGKPFLVMEQSPNQQNWQPYNKLKRPGEIRRIAYQGIAHGSDSCLYFQMRQSVGGQEKFHGAVISHADRDDTRIFQEFSQLGAELKKLGSSCLEEGTRAEVGFLFDWSNWWALELTSGPTADMDYLQQVHQYYKPFYDGNIPVDFLKISSDFSGYKILVLPLLYMISDELAERLRCFTKNGGTLVGTYMTGLADENDRCVFGAYPGPLRDVFGLWVEETDAMYPGQKNTMLFKEPDAEGFFKKGGQCGFLCDLIHAQQADVLAVYGENFYKGMPCLTENRFGKGRAYYLASQPDENLLRRFVSRICEEQQVTPLIRTDGRVEVCARGNRNERSIYIINQGESEGTVYLEDRVYNNLLNDRQLSGTVNIAGGDVWVLKEKQATHD